MLSERRPESESMGMTEYRSWKTIIITFTGYTG